MISFPRTMMMALALPTVAGRASGQDSSRSASAWSVTVELGGFVQGNGAAVTRWLRDNAYGVAEPKHCGFDFIFRTVCQDAVSYPRASALHVVAMMGSIRRRLGDRFSLALFGATEQAGTVTGRCDDVAVPRDPRCTTRFMDVRISGGSVALLPVVAARSVHIGLGPALLLANWTMKPAHLAGLWVDGTLERNGFPLFAHVQYRIYRSTSLSPSDGFTGFHPSTLYAGLGFIARTNNGPDQ